MPNYHASGDLMYIENICSVIILQKINLQHLYFILVLLRRTRNADRERNAEGEEEIGEVGVGKTRK